MKTLILYGSRKGCARKCAAMVQEQAGGGDVIDVQKEKAGVTQSYNRLKLDAISRFSEGVREGSAEVRKADLVAEPVGRRRTS
jgi:menaquinone-dependent protoporphyrinogen IX oxidase